MAYKCKYIMVIDGAPNEFLGFRNLKKAERETLLIDRGGTADVREGSECEQLHIFMSADATDAQWYIDNYPADAVVLHETDPTGLEHPNLYTTDDILPDDLQSAVDIINGG